MKKYTTNKNALIQITTKLTQENHLYIINLREWFSNKEVVLSQQEIINNIIEHSFKSNEAAIQIDHNSFTYSEIIEELEQQKINTINDLAVYALNWLEKKTSIQSVSKTSVAEVGTAISTNYDDLRKALSNQYKELSTHSGDIFKGMDDLDMANAVMTEMGSIAKKLEG